MALIPENVVEEIKNKNDIADVIGTYVTLKRAGANMNGLCPFHNEKSPSFTVFTATQSFYCFGCAAAGDVVTFVRKINNLDYVEALRHLAKRVGITVPEGADGKGGLRRSRMYEMNKAAARYFRSQLANANEARAYIVKRQLAPNTVARFGIGFAPNSWNDFMNHMKSCGYNEDELINAQLARRNEKGICYPFFRNRVMFPIIDTTGSIVGFGGRVMDDSKPKYLNTSETMVFNKSKTLFALNYAKDHCSDSLIVCEGYMDAISLHAAGFQNTVATLGTALTQEHARLIKRYTNKVILIYDKDEAGKRATDRGMNVLSQVGLDVKILRIDGAKDPDEYIKSYGAAAFAQLLKGSDSKFDYIVKNITEKYDINTDDGRIKASKAFCAEIAGFDSAVERELYTDRIAKLLSVSVTSIESEVKKSLRARNKAESTAFEKRMQDKSLGIGDKINPEYSANPKAASAEEAILGIMMTFPERAADIIKGKFELSEDDFVTSFNKRVFTELKTLFSEGCYDITPLGEKLTAEEMGRVYEMRIRREGLDSSSETVIRDSIAALKGSRVTGETDIAKIILAKLAEGKNK